MNSKHPPTDRDEQAAAINYDGPDESVECAYPGCTNRLRRAAFTDEPQFCSKEHRDGRSAARGPDDPLAGLPDDLARVLRDSTIKVPQDEYRMPDGRTLWEHLEEWRNAPSDTASADLPHVKPPTASPIEIIKERQRDD